MFPFFSLFLILIVYNVWALRWRLSLSLALNDSHCAEKEKIDRDNTYPASNLCVASRGRSTVDSRRHRKSTDKIEQGRFRE